LARRLPQQDHVWVEARRRFRLSHVQVQMARELGMNPKKLSKLANDRQEPWKEPLPQFIESLYLKRFGRERPAVVLSAQRAGQAGREGGDTQVGEGAEPRDSGR
jgi:hypothetical protein